MRIRNTNTQWGTIQQAFHWIVVVAVLCQLAVGFIFADLSPQSLLRASLFPIHTSLGLSILGLMLARLLWRGANPVPALPDTLRPWQKRLARANHGLLYLLLIGLPMGGYLLVSAHGHSIPFFGHELPPVIPENKPLQGTALFLHVTGAFILIGLVALHVAAALRHEWLLKDGVLRRMAPFFARRE